MTFGKEIIKNDEKAIFELRSLYQKYGYRQYKMSKFEEYDFYAKNKDFLVSDSIITFNDINGRLMALKPDVTLSIVKNAQDNSLTKMYYNENVYRVAPGTHCFKEIMQTGLECIGNIDSYNICEVIMLAERSLMAISNEFVLDISHMGFISAILGGIDADYKIKDKIVKCIGEKNLHEIKSVCKENGIDYEAIELITSTYGDGDYVLKKLKDWANTDELKSVLEELEAINNFLKDNGFSENVRFDFSIVNDMDYYSGVVFKGYIKGISSSVLSGGQYGKLMHRMGKKCDAIGFAVYLDMLERLNGSAKKYDVDTVILYDENADASALYKNIKMLADNGISVLALKELTDVKYRQLLKFNGKGVEILECND